MIIALFILKNKGKNIILEVIKFLEKVRNTIHPQPLALFVCGFAYQSKINTWLILVNSRICQWQPHTHTHTQTQTHTHTRAYNCDYSPSFEVNSS